MMKKNKDGFWITKEPNKATCMAKLDNICIEALDKYTPTDSIAITVTLSILDIKYLHEVLNIYLNSTEKVD